MSPAKPVDLRYEIDANNLIRRIDGPWDDFAASNDAEELYRGSVLGHRLFDFIQSEEVAELYSRLFDAIRRTGRSAAFQFRCDGPGVRRQLCMYLTRLKDGVIEIRTKTLTSDQREPLALMDRTAPRTDEMLRMCSYCNRIHLADRGWEEIENAINTLGLFERTALPSITHGICDECLTAQKELLDRLRGQQH